MPVVGIKTRTCTTRSHISAKVRFTFFHLKFLSRVAGGIEKKRR